MFLIDSDINLYYEFIGNGVPVLMLHGCPCDHRLMKGCMEPIFEKTQEYKRIYLDLPGMGKSTATLAYANSDKLLECICNFIDYVVEKDFIIVGESYGAYLANGVVKKFQDRVKGIAFICPVVVADNKKRVLPNCNIKKYDSAFLGTLSEKEREKFCKYAVVANEHTYKRYKAEIESGVNIANKKFVRLLEQNYVLSDSLPESDNITTFENPVLIITGRQDNCVGYRDASILFSEYTRATMTILDCAGHNLQIEHPRVFSVLIEEWLEGIADYCKINPSLT